MPLLLLGAIVIAVVVVYGTQAQASTGNETQQQPSTLSQIMTPNLSVSQIATVAANAGFTGDDLVTAVAIALAESKGNPKAYNPETAAKGGTPQGKGSYGLWQIYLKDHPEDANVDLTDPQTNANAAYNVYVNAGYDFTPWSTYSYQEINNVWTHVGAGQGVYLNNIDVAQAAVDNLGLA